MPISNGKQWACPTLFPFLQKKADLPFTSLQFQLYLYLSTSKCIYPNYKMFFLNLTKCICQNLSHIISFSGNETLSGLLLHCNSTIAYICQNKNVPIQITTCIFLNLTKCICPTLFPFLATKLNLVSYCAAILLFLNSALCSVHTSSPYTAAGCFIYIL